MATGIEWTDETWNPTVGCTKITAGCKHCYAEGMHARLTAMGVEKYAEPFRRVRPWPAALEQPLQWTRPRRIFVNSMSDLFHEDLPLEYIGQVFDVMQRAPQHTFQVLTKRSGRLAEVAAALPWPGNVWMGVSVENAGQIERIHDLARVPAAVRFLSLEPLLGRISALPLDGIHWVIGGGESGPGARECNVDWIRDIMARCALAQVPFFLKQLGANCIDYVGQIVGAAGQVDDSDEGIFSHYRRLRDRKGGDPSEWPEYLRVREWPTAATDAGRAP
jgi:protein gp37